MRFINQNKITKELVSVFNLEMFFELYIRLEDENHSSPFDGSKDFYMIQLLAINRAELSSDYDQITC